MDDKPEPLDWDEDEVTSDSTAERKETTTLRLASVLHQAEGPGAPQDFLLNRDSMVVGRLAEAEIRIHASSISRRHMLIERVGPEFRIRDLDSRNGVFLNGIKAHSAVLHAGDQIQIGDVLLIFHSSRKDPAP